MKPCLGCGVSVCQCYAFEWVGTTAPSMTENITIDQRYKFEKEIEALRKERDELKQKLLTNHVGTIAYLRVEIDEVQAERDAYREALEFFDKTVDPHGLERDYQTVTHECADKIEAVLAKYPKEKTNG